MPFIEKCKYWRHGEEREETDWRVPSAECRVPSTSGNTKKANIFKKMRALIKRKRKKMSDGGEERKSSIRRPTEFV